MGATKRAVVIGSGCLVPVAILVGVRFVHPVADVAIAAVALNLPLVLLWREARARVLGPIAIVASVCSVPFVTCLAGVSPSVVTAEGHSNSGHRLRLYWADLGATGYALALRAEKGIAGILRLSWRLEEPDARTPGPLVVRWCDEDVVLEPVGRQ